MTNSRGGCAGMLAAGALEAAARVVDGVMGPPEDDATFARITDRCGLPAHGLYPDHVLGVGAGAAQTHWSRHSLASPRPHGGGTCPTHPVSKLHVRKHEA